MTHKASPRLCRGYLTVRPQEAQPTYLRVQHSHAVSLQWDLVLHGRVQRAQVAEAGRNIIARGLKFSGRLPPGVTLKLRVAGFAPPLPEDGDPAGLLQTLARLLLDIGNDPHGRALRFVGSPDSSPWRSSPWPKHDELPPRSPPTVDELLSVEHSRPKRTTSLH